MPAFNDEQTPDATHAIVDLTPSEPQHVPDDLERRLLRKLDLRMSIIVVIYALNYIDRANAANARLQGFEQDLHLHGQQYATVLSIFYVGYIIMQVPANMFMHWLERPSSILPTCMIIWGAISTLTGIAKNYTDVLLARFFLGFVEAPFYPGVLFLISRWYKRDEIALRATLVTCGSPISNGFGSLIASGILQRMQGKLGRAAWRWLFYIEGSMTIFVAICAVFILPDFPHNTRWLTPEERALAISRLAEDNNGTTGKEDRTTIEGLRDAVTDWKVWWFAAVFLAQVLAQSFYLYFPTLSATMGYDTTTTLLLCAPPWVFCTICAFAVSRYSDKKQNRYRYVVAVNALAALGFIISICAMNTVARYISFFLMVQAYAGYMVLWGWVNNTFAGDPAKRAVAVALINALSQLGTIGGSYIWPTNWGPTYRYSYAVCIAALGVSTGMSGAMRFYLRRFNERSERKELDAKDNEGLREPAGFRYML